MSQKGKKYNDDIKEKAYALLATNNNFSEVARQLNVPRSTIKSWYDNKSDDKAYVKLRQKKKEEFVDSAWEIIGNAQSLIGRKLKRALDKEEELDVVLEAVEDEVNWEDKKSVAVARKISNKISELKIEDLRDLAITLGTVYDKQALANNEATERTESNITVLFNIPRPPKRN